MPVTIEHSLRKRYPFAAIRGQRITRMEEANLGSFQLDAETAERLAEENIGVFIGGCRDWDWMLDRLNTLAETRYPVPGRADDPAAGGDGVHERNLRTGAGKANPRANVLEPPQCDVYDPGRHRFLPRLHH